MCPNYHESQNPGKLSEPTLSKAELKRNKVLLYYAFALLLLTKEVPGHVKKKLDNEDLSILVNNLTALAINQVAKRKQKLQDIGTSPKKYVKIFTNAYAGQMRPVKMAIKESEKKLDLKKKKNNSKGSEIKTPTKRHLEIVSEYLKDIPSAKEVGNQQKILIVAGPIGSGKTELLKQLKPKNMVNIDLDVIRGKLDPDYNQANQHDIQRVREESWFVSDLILMRALEEGKSVIIQTPLHRRSRWMNDERLLYAKKQGIPIEINMILRPWPDCLSRNINRQSRSATLKDSYKSMNGMSVLVELVQKFGNITKVNLVNFYPMFKQTQILNSEAFFDQYLKLISYAAKRPDIFSIYKKSTDLQILD